MIEESQQAAPTDGLWGDGRKDEDQIGASYEEIEFVMKTIEMKSKETLTSRQEEVLKLYKNLNSQNKHKMNPVPVCKVPKYLKNSIQF